MAATKTSKPQKTKPRKAKSNQSNILKPDYDLTLEQLDQFRDQAAKLLRSRKSEAFIDLESVKQIDGPGLTSLLMIHQSFLDKGKCLTILTNNPDWTDLFQTTGVDEFLTVKDAV